MEDVVLISGPKTGGKNSGSCYGRYPHTYVVTVGAVLKQLNYQKTDFIIQTKDEVHRQIVKFLDVEYFPGIDYD